jgi:hypothetical protein
MEAAIPDRGIALHEVHIVYARWKIKVKENWLTRRKAFLTM